MYEIIPWSFQFCSNAVLWFPVLYDSLINEFKIRKQDIVWITGINYFCIFFSNSVGSLLIYKLDTKKAGLISMIIYIIGLIFSLLSTNLTLLIITYSIISGIGSGLLLNLALFLVYDYFDNEIALSKICFIFTGASITSILFGNLFGYLVQIINWRFCLSIYIIINLIMILPLYLKSNLTKKSNNIKFELKKYMTKKYILLIISSFFFGFSYLPVFTNFLIFIKEKKIYDNVLLENLSFSMIQISGFLSYFIFFVLYKKNKISIQPTLLVLVSFIGISSLYIWWIHLNDKISAMIFPFIFGLLFGNFFIHFNLITIEIFKKEVHTLIIGILNSNLSIGLLLGSYIYNILVEKSNHLTACLFFFGTSIIASMFLLLSMIINK